MLEFRGQRWSLGECSLSVWLPLNPHTLPEVWWSLDLAAHPGAGNSRGCSSLPVLHVSVQPLFIPVRGWRELANNELKVDASWQDAHEFVNEDGEVQWTEIEARWWPDRSVNNARYWIGDQFTVRFGSWDQERIICELEGFLDAEEDYYRDPPKTACKGGASASSSSHLLLMGQPSISKCEVEVPGDIADPVTWARAKVSRQLELRDFRSIETRLIGSDGESNARSRKVTLMPSFERQST